MYFYINLCNLYNRNLEFHIRKGTIVVLFYAYLVLYHKILLLTIVFADIYKLNNSVNIYFSINKQFRYIVLRLLQDMLRRRADCCIKIWYLQFRFTRLLIGLINIQDYIVRRLDFIIDAKLMQILLSYTMQWETFESNLIPHSLVKYVDYTAQS